MSHPVFSPHGGLENKVMYGSTDDYLPPARFGSRLGVQKRQTAKVLGQLEALGFDLPSDAHGARKIHPDLAQAVLAARANGADLSDLAVLRDDPDLAKFLRPDRRSAEDLLSILVDLGSEVAIVREVASAVAEGARLHLGSAYRAPDWSAMGLPDPRSDL